MSELVERVTPDDFEEPELIYYWRTRDGDSGRIVVEGSDTMYSLCMPSGTILVVEMVPRYYDIDLPPNGSSDDEIDNPTFSGNDLFVEYYRESDNLDYSFVGREGRTITNNV